jgi:hypothetical protein
MNAKELAREKLEKDTQAFLNSGGQVQVIPQGVSKDHVFVGKGTDWRSKKLGVRT